MQGVGTRGRLGRLEAQGRCPDGMSMQRRIQNCDLRLVRPVPQTHPAHQVQSEILAEAFYKSQAKSPAILDRKDSEKTK